MANDGYSGSATAELMENFPSDPEKLKAAIRQTGGLR
jgi:hypothetical protein